MTDVSKQTNVMLCSPEKMLKKMRKNTFMSAHMVGPPQARGKLYEVRTKKEKALHKFPAFVAMAILEASKRKLQEFAYDLLKTFRPSAYSLCALDTDGWIFGISAQKYEDCLRPGAEQEFKAIANKIMFRYKQQDCRERNLPSPMKIGSYIEEADYSRVISLGPKCTCAEYLHSNRAKTSLKGVQRSVRAEIFTCNLFEEAVFLTQPIQAPVFSIRHIRGHMFTINSVKRTLATPILKGYLMNDFLTVRVHYWL